MLLLDFFSVKESTEGFIYITKRSNANLIILDLLSSHKHWKERYFFVGGRNWEYNLVDREDMLGILTAWTATENLRELSFAFNWVELTKVMRCFLTSFWLCDLQVFAPASTSRMKR